MIKPFSLNRKELKLNLRSDADESVFYEIFQGREYKILDPFIKNSRTLILDVGAHIGLFSIYARTFNPLVKIWSCEPEEENFAALKENLKLNNVKNIEIKNLAVSDKTQEEMMFLSEDSHNHSLLKEAKVDSDKCKKVRTTTIDRILERYDVCDLIKMDCEGAEFKIIQSIAPETFKKIKAIYIEYHKYHENLKVEELTDNLRKNNFKKIQIFESHYEKNLGFILAVK